MALAQYMRNEEYFSFFRERVEKGETVILDNGAYEGVLVPTHELLRIANELHPAVVVLPDVPGDMLKTLQRGLNFLDMHSLPRGTESMMVLHAEDGQLGHFETMYNLCPTKWVGFSRLTKFYRPGWVRQDNRRNFVAHLINSHQFRGDVHHHALGMSNGYTPELRSLSMYGFRSCDSSAPIWRGLHGYTLTDTSWPNYSFDPLMDVDSWNWDLASQNLSSVQELCKEE